MVELSTGSTQTILSTQGLTSRTHGPGVGGWGAWNTVTSDHLRSLTTLKVLAADSDLDLDACVFSNCEVLVSATVFLFAY